MMQTLSDDPEATLARFYIQVADGHPEQAECLTLLKNAVPSPAFSPSGLQDGLHYLRDSDLSLVAAELTIPVLRIHGDADKICPLAGLKKSLPNQNINVVKSGHAPMLTNPEQLAGWIQEFLTTRSHG